jgi:hypothetical protein
MIAPFDPRDPFPLVADAEAFHDAGIAHAEEADRWLGVRTHEVEEELRARTTAPDGQELWLTLPVKSLLTPYTELRALLARVAPAAGGTVVDLGAGYGRMGFVIGFHHPGVRFVGYEYVRERVDEANRALARHGWPLVSMERADLAAADFIPCAADVYFLYDYGSRDAIEKTLGDLRVIALRRGVTVVGRGRACRDAIERRHPWLAEVVAPEHGPHASIYRSRG